MAANDTLMIPMPSGTRVYAYTQKGGTTDATGGAADVKIVANIPLHETAQLVLEADGSIRVDLEGTGGTTEPEGASEW